MSLVILGMEMPNSCESCGVTCELWMRHKVGQRHSDCPLRPLPEKHGRLISADEAYDRIMEQEGGYYIDMDGVGMGLDECQTIVEAEGEYG